MTVIPSIADLRSLLAARRAAGASVGLVPTMGFLHEGHLSLIRRAAAENDIVVVSSFVNPTQFGPGEDYDSYPRDPDRDVALARQAGATVVFQPTVEEMYPAGAATFVEVTGALTQPLCGRSRPGHFRGVATVVAMLFTIVGPDRAYFGQKDAQQVAVIRRMVRDLHFPIEIVACPIVREPDGLALSSRNVRLSGAARAQALTLSAGLDQARRAVAAGEYRVATLLGMIRATIEAAPLAAIDYVEILDADTLKPLDGITPGTRALAAVAVRFGSVRLIDNAVLEQGA